MQGFDVFVVKPHATMGNRSTDGPAVGSAVKTSGGRAFDRDPAITVMGIPTQTVLMKGDPMAAKGVAWPLLFQPLPVTG